MREGPSKSIFRYRIGSGLGTGVFSALTIYGLGKLQQKIENKIACGAESGERQRNLDKWGTDSNGCNQGERHFNNYWEKYPESFLYDLNRD